MAGVRDFAQLGGARIQRWPSSDTGTAETANTGRLHRRPATDQDGIIETHGTAFAAVRLIVARTPVIDLRRPIARVAIIGRILCAVASSLAAFPAAAMEEGSRVAYESGRRPSHSDIWTSAVAEADAKHARFAGEAASRTVLKVADWIVASDDPEGLPSPSSTR